MFRFSIRDLLWLILVLAVGLAGFVRERQLRAEVDRLGERTNRWRLAAGALEHYCNENGWKVKWNWESSEVVLDSYDGHKTFGKISTRSYEPSSKDWP